MFIFFWMEGSKRVTSHFLKFELGVAFIEFEYCVQSFTVGIACYFFCHFHPWNLISTIHQTKTDT